MEQWWKRESSGQTALHTNSQPAPDASLSLSLPRILHYTLPRFFLRPPSLSSHEKEQATASAQQGKPPWSSIRSIAEEAEARPRFLFLVHSLSPLSLAFPVAKNSSHLEEAARFYWSLRPDRCLQGLDSLGRGRDRVRTKFWSLRLVLHDWIELDLIFGADILIWNGFAFFFLSLFLV